MATPINSQKKTQGVFYTPYHVAEVICNWAIKSQSDVIMEPSFGGCEFLKAAHSRLLALSDTKEKNLSGLYGCDIDPSAFTYLKEIIPNSNGHFVQADFMTLRNSNFPNQSRFDVILGNPPYVSHHNMLAEQKESASNWLEETKMNLNGRASLWAYFVLHSLSFLKDRGRIAWILPGSFLHSEYAVSVRSKLENHFERLLAVQLGERLFVGEGTEEISIILLGEGYLSSPLEKTSTSFGFTTYAADLPEIIENWNNNKTISLSDAKFATLTGKGKKTFQAVANSPNTYSLGDLLDIRIGVVSGANKFFILNQETWDEHSLPKNISSQVLTTFKLVKGIAFTDDDFSDIRAEGNKCLLVDTTKTDAITGNLKEYLDTFPEEKRKSTTTFQRRSISGVWHRFNDGLIPDAFFPYMQNTGPSIVLNETKVCSTNSIHRLYFKENMSETKKKVIAISMLSTFSQLSAEFTGRIYGAGVLKHEPSEALRIQVYLPSSPDSDQVEQVFQEIDQLMRDEKREQAQAIADKFIQKDMLSNDISYNIDALKNTLTKTRVRRFPVKE